MFSYKFNKGIDNQNADDRKYNDINCELYNNIQLIFTKNKHNNIITIYCLKKF